MKKIFTLLNKKPPLYSQGSHQLWENPHISKGMLKAHLDENLDSATRNLQSVKTSVHWITETLPPCDYPTLLDLGCGPGIYTELFYEKGYQVSGLDISKNSIQYARNSAKQKDYQITYTCNNYIHVKLDKKYHLITLIYCDFGVLSSTDRTLLLKKIYDALLPGGAFVFDVFTSLKYIDMQEYKDWEYSDEGFWYDKPHINIHAFFRYDEQNTYLNQHVIIGEEELCTYHIWEHTFTKEELLHDLQLAGFHDISFYQSIAGGECQLDDETICVIAKKL